MEKRLIIKLCVMGAFLAAACIGWTTQQAWAHRVNVFAYVEGGQLAGEGYFPGGKSAQDCKVVVYDAGGAQIGESKTIADGTFSMPLPKGQPPFTVVLEAGSGHKTKYVLSAKEMGLAKPEAAKAETHPAAGKDQPAAKGGEQVANARNSVTMDEVRKAVGEEMDRRLRPLQAQVARLAAERGVGVSDVIGGLGYILGLVGLAAWFKSRKTS